MNRFLRTVLFVLLSGTLVSFPVFNAFAQAATTTPTDTPSLIKKLQDIVQSLQKQILELKTQLAAARGELEEVEVEIKELKITKTLARGARNGEVRSLQEFLKQNSEIYPEGLSTGFFGPATEQAVKRFQQKYGIEQVGIVGPKTRAKLQELAAKERGTEKPGKILPATPAATTTPEGKIVICHIPPGNSGNKHTIEIDKSALTAHLAHGDTAGACGISPALPPPPTATTSPPSVLPPPPVQLPPPPSQTSPPPPSPGTATTTPPAALPPPPTGGPPPPPPVAPPPPPPVGPPPPPPSSSSVDFELVYKTPQVTVAQGGVATVVVDAVPISGTPYPPWVYLDLFHIEGGTNKLSWGGGGTESCPIPCSIERTLYINSDAAPGNYTVTGLVSDKIYPLSRPPGEAIIKNLSVPLTITASSSTARISQSTLASIFQSLGAVLNDLQKQIQKLVR